MHYLRLLVLTVFSLCLSLTPLHAINLPPFDPTSSAWFSTHIVMVRPADDHAGLMNVLESWKGELAPGTNLWIPEFVRYTESDGMSDIRSVDLAGMLKVPETRIILFLRKMDYPWRIEKGRVHEWMPANREDFSGSYSEMVVSFAWIKNGKVYGLQQDSNPGPYIPHCYFQSEADAKKHIYRFTELRQRCDEALAERNDTAKVERLRSLVQQAQEEGKRNRVPRLVWQTLQDFEPYSMDLRRKVFYDYHEDSNTVPIWRVSLAQLLAQDKELRMKNELHLPQPPVRLLQHASSIWKTNDPLPPPPFENMGRAWESVHFALYCLEESKLKLREMKLAQRQEVLALAKEISAYVRMAPERTSEYQKAAGRRAENIVKELSFAVPAKNAEKK